MSDALYCPNTLGLPESLVLAMTDEEYDTEMNQANNNPDIEGITSDMFLDKNDLKLLALSFD
ncbi:MAG: hypothetical protein HW380_1619 [Magnetococcales bacterium]|nr:hypothetical protein [Magnetococcales bacterium]HIJ83184.1 hypothetical protein [Magnetococcales bacterium]